METIHKMFGNMEEGRIKDPWLFFIDFKGAYNGIDHNILFKKLRKKGIKNSTINLIKLYFKSI